MKRGLCSVSFRSMAVEDIVALAGSAGLSAIEWGGDVHVPHGDLAEARRVAGLTAAAGLEVAAYGSYYRAGVSEAQGLAFSAVLETARVLGTDRIRIWAGTANAEDVNASGWTTIADDIRRVSELARQAGVSVVLEFHANTLTNSYASAHRLLQELPQTGLIWQPISRLSVENNLAGIRLLSPWIRHVHCFYAAPPTFEKSALEEGAAIWKSYLAQLRTLPAVRHVLMEFVKDHSAGQLRTDAGTLGRLLDESAA